VGLLVAVCFSPCWWGRVLAPFDLLQELVAPWQSGVSEAVPAIHNHFVSDACTQYIPYALFTQASYQRDGFVGWNPLILGGVAQDANTMTLPDDWSRQLFRFLDFWSAWHGGRAAQFLIAGLGMLLFLRGVGCRPSVALLGAVAYMLNTQFVVWIYHQWALASFAWVPWLLWSLDQGKKSSERYLALAALFLAMSFFGGTLQHAAFVALVLFCLWLGWLWEARPQMQPTIRSTLSLVVVGILGAGMAAPMFEPTILSYVENLRAGNIRGTLGYPGGAWQPWLNLVSIFPYAFPSVMGSTSSLDLWKLLKSDAFNVASFGTVPVILAFVAMGKRNMPKAAKILVLAGLILPLTPLVGPLYHRVQLLWILGGCWLVSTWLEDADQEALQRVGRRLWVGLGAGAALWLILSVFLHVTAAWLEPWAQQKVALLSHKSQFGYFSEWMKQRTGTLFQYLMIWNPLQILVLGGAAVSVLGLRTIQSGKGGWPWLAAAGVALQSSVFWWQWTTWSNRTAEIYQEPPLVKVLQKEVGWNGRLAQESGSYALLPLLPNTLQPSGVGVAGGYESIHPNGLKGRTDQPWDFPGATHYLAGADSGAPPGWKELWTDGVWRLFKNPDPKDGLVKIVEGGRQALSGGTLLRQGYSAMTVELPAGTVEVELFCNGHRGWKWAMHRAGPWLPTVKGSQGGVAFALAFPLTKIEQVYLRYDPAPPPWVFGVAGMGVLGVAIIAVFGRRLNSSSP